MDISYLGHSSFRLKTKSAILVTDPYSSEMLGFKFPKTEADIVTISHSHPDHNNLQGITNEPFVINSPGEYEVKGVSVFGFPSYHDAQSGAKRGGNSIFLIETEGLRICHLGDLGAIPSPKIMEEIIGADILMVPVGGTVTLGPKEAVEIVNQIEPIIVLPMHYKEPGINEAEFGELTDLKEFLAEMGAEQAERLDKLSISKDKLPEETKVFVLERKS